jgi:hypothetical protein
MLNRSVVALVVFSLAVAAGTYGVYLLAHWPFGVEQLAMIGFLAIVTGVLYIWQEQALAKDPKGFLFRFMIGLVLKLVAALVVVAGLLLLLPRARAVPLSLTFAVLYLLFLVFSTVRLSTRSRNAPRP